MRVVSFLIERLEREPISEDRESLLSAALLGKAAAIEAIQLATDDVTPEVMLEGVPKTIEHLLSLGLRTFQKSDAPWECAINECQLILMTAVEDLKKIQVPELEATQSTFLQELLSSRIEMLNQNHSITIEVNGESEESIAPSVSYAIYQFARENGRFMAHTSPQLAWSALHIGRHTSALRRAECREQTEDGEYETGIPWTKGDPYNPD